MVREPFTISIAVGVMFRDFIYARKNKVIYELNKKCRLGKKLKILLMTVKKHDMHWQKSTRKYDAAMSARLI